MRETQNRIDRRGFLKTFGASLALSPLLSPNSAPLLAQPKRRNIIFILIDDQRYDFLSCLGHPWIETPNIDQLATNGIIFENAFVTTSLCSPSRASILTGQYAHEHQVMDNDTPVPKGTQTFPVELQKNGYKTAFVGKWHMGGLSDEPRPGFDHWVSFRGQGPYFDPRLNINGSHKDVEGYTTDILTDYTCEFIRDNKHSDQPYCLYLSHKSIHEDFTPAPRHEGRYRDLKVPRPDTYADSPENYEGKPGWLEEQRESWHGVERDFSIHDYGSFDQFVRRYSECMLGVDDSIGKITETLRKLNQLDDTIIIYYSDNGYLLGEHGLIDKRVMYEESIRVPCFVHCPALIREPKRDTSFILNIDLAPTILDIAGVPKPGSMHGESFFPILKSEPTQWRTDFVYEYFFDPNAPQTPVTFGLRNEKYSYMTYYGVWDVNELYDLKKDPRQKNNLLGDIRWGNTYGTFNRHVRQQNPQLYAFVEKLDNRLTGLLEVTNGKRQPTWHY